MSNHVSAPLVLVEPSIEPGVVKTIACMGYDAGRAASSPDTVGEALRLAAGWGPRLERPGQGRTAELWSALATLGSVDLTVARVVEPHLDALAILAEAQASDGLEAAGIPATPRGGCMPPRGRVSGSPRWRWGRAGSSTGTKPWCSLADRVSHALVTAWVDDSTRGLFALDLGESGVRAAAGGRGVGEPRPARGHELRGRGDAGARPDRWGRRAGTSSAPASRGAGSVSRPSGSGPRSPWAGGSGGTSSQRAADQVAQLHIGQLDLAPVHAPAPRWRRPRGRRTAGSTASRPGWSLRAPAAWWPRRSRPCSGSPTTRWARGRSRPDAEHAQRVSDLRLYVRQHHAERDVADLGRQVLADAGPDGLW